MSILQDCPCAFCNEMDLEHKYYQIFIKITCCGNAKLEETFC